MIVTRSARIVRRDSASFAGESRGAELQVSGLNLISTKKRYNVLFDGSPSSRHDIDTHGECPAFFT